MPRTKKKVDTHPVKTKKEKLSSEQRSAIAKARWARRRESEPAQDTETHEIKYVNSETGQASDPSPVPQELIAEGLSGTPINAEPFSPEPSVTALPLVTEPTTPTPAPQEVTQDTVSTDLDGSKESKDRFKKALADTSKQEPVPAPQLAPKRAPKQKRYQGPKEFKTALGAAEKRMAAVLKEQSDFLKQRALIDSKLQAIHTEIPLLVNVIKALGGSSTPVPNMPFDITGMYPPAVPFQAPVAQPQAPMNIQQVLAAAQVAPPSFGKANGGAVQFSADVVGTLEGPQDDDDMDKFISGPNAGDGWIGE